MILQLLILKRGIPIIVPDNGTTTTGRSKNSKCIYGIELQEGRSQVSDFDG
jgi:hypothetical protein